MASNCKDVKSNVSYPKHYDENIGNFDPECCRVNKVVMFLTNIAMREREEKKREQEEKMKKIHMDGLSVKLFSYQQKGVEWMLQKERNTKVRGGFLCDEMGLGKTLQMIALMLKSKQDMIDAYNLQIGNENLKRLVCMTYKERTLIIAPLAVLDQWAEEIKCKAPNKFKVHVYYGNNRRIKSQSMVEQYRGCDVIITTYGVVTTEYAKGVVENQRGLFSLPSKSHFFYRIILDDAHTIKNHSTQQSKACVAIAKSSETHWCLTGTPLQNGIMDIYSLCKFLQIDWAADMNQFKTFFDVKQSKKVKVTDENYSYQTETYSKANIVSFMSDFMLRRTKKKVYMECLDMPDKTTQVVALTLTKSEQDEYDLFRKQNTMKLNKRGANNTQWLYIQALVKLMRLRQICNHPQLLKKDLVSKINEIGISNCAQENFDKFEQLLTNLNNLDNDEIHEYEGSTKTKFVMKRIRGIRKFYPTDKIVIFSQFTEMLHIFKHMLTKQKIRYLIYTGDENRKERNDIINKFKNDQSNAIPVILMSLQCAAVGINLTCANHVIFFDLWWNKTMELQAVDRVHRIGQQKHVFVTKIFTKRTIEKNIFEMQKGRQDQIENILTNAKFVAENGLSFQKLTSLLQ